MTEPAFTGSENLAELILDLTTRAAALRDDQIEEIEPLAVAGFSRAAELIRDGKIA